MNRKVTHRLLTIGMVGLALWALSGAAAPALALADVSHLSSADEALAFGQEFAAVCKVGRRGGDGTLIRPRWVLTAAHVARGMYERTQGKLSIFCDEHEYKVQQVFVHPRSGAMSKHDIGLLRLERAVKDITPIPIYAKADELGKQIVLAGHGDKRDPHNNWIKDGRLRAYTNQIDDVSELRIVFDYDGPDGNPTDQEGTSGPGDSGGPALIADGDSYRVAGISSMGHPGKNGPATFGAIEHFVRVSNFQDWIAQTISNPRPDLALSAKDAQPMPGRREGRSGVVVSSPGSGSGMPAPASSRRAFSDSDQATTARLFLGALETYSDETMKAAIERTFAASTLSRKSPTEVMANTPVLFRQLQHAKLKGVVSESSEMIVVELTTAEASYILKMFFDDRQVDKLSELMFGRLSG
jgi:hypothetical protein